RLRRTLVERGVTKYNAGAASPALIPSSRKRRLFVPGQVEDDQSVLLGGAGILSNLELLARVRAENPDAFLIYQPHPDVEARYRRGAVPDAAVLRLADCVVRGLSAASIASVVDEVHTLSSLAGFEALLRDCPVTCYGQPFYAGWGLTRDRAPIPRR